MSHARRQNGDLAIVKANRFGHNTHATTGKYSELHTSSTKREQGATASSLDLGLRSLEDDLKSLRTQMSAETEQLKHAIEESNRMMLEQMQSIKDTLLMNHRKQ